MPLRDHFRPPVWNQASWEGFHGGWPMMMVLDLAPKLPKGFAAEPRVHLGTSFEIDVCTFDKDGQGDWHSDPDPVPDGGVATATLAPPAPTLTVDIDLPDQCVGVRCAHKTGMRQPFETEIIEILATARDQPHVFLASNRLTHTVFHHCRACVCRSGLGATR